MSKQVREEIELLKEALKRGLHVRERDISDPVDVRLELELLSARVSALEETIDTTPDECQEAYRDQLLATVRRYERELSDRAGREVKLYAAHHH